MPNYCECWLKFYASDTVSVEDVLSALSDGEHAVDFEKFTPYPAELKKADDSYKNWRIGFVEYPVGPGAYEDYCRKNPPPEDGYNHGGYEWCIQNWGTKWNAIDPKIVEQDDYEAIITFDTAWSPPLPIIDKLAAMFADVSFCFEYYEMGMAFCGSIRYEDGVRKYQAKGEYHGFRGG